MPDDAPVIKMAEVIWNSPESGVFIARYAFSCNAVPFSNAALRL